MVVIPISPKINSLFNKSGNSKAFQIISFIFVLYHLIFGLDFGFFKLQSFKIKLFFKFFSCSKSLLLCYLCVPNINIFKNIEVFFYFTISFFHYHTYVILLCFNNSDITFCDLLLDLEIIDLGLRVDKSSYNLEIKIILAIFASFFIRAVLQAAFCILSRECLLDLWIIVLYIFLNECTNLVHITNSFLFYSVNCRLNKLISILEKPNADIMYLKHIYKSLVDVTEKYKAAFDMVFLASLLFYIPDAMSTIYFSVSEIMRRRTTTIEEIYSMDLCMNCATVITASILTLLPALCAGALTSQASKLKLMLHDKLLQQQEEDRIQEIERFIGYVETRGCRFRVCQVIPLNADLLGMVFDFCITYLIVIIQFTDYKS